MRWGAADDRRGGAPKDPEPIFFPSLYLPPTRRSSLWFDDWSAMIGGVERRSWAEGLATEQERRGKEEEGKYMGGAYIVANMWIKASR